MKVAICLSGEMRSFKETSSFVETNLINPFNADVFIHTWSHCGKSPKVRNPRKMPQGKQKHNDPVTRYDLKRNYKSLINYCIEDFMPKYYYSICGIEAPSHLVDNRYHLPNDGFKNSLPMYYSMFYANDLKKKYEIDYDFKYDCVIRLRPDFIPNPIPQKVLKNLNILWVQILNHKKISDKYAISNSPNMDYYCSVFKKLPIYWRRKTSIKENELTEKDCPPGERLMKYHLQQSTIKIKEI